MAAAAASSSFFKNKGVQFVTLGWVGFIAENLLLSHNRDFIIQNYGDDQYHIVYNILSTAACSSIAYGYFKYGKVGTPLSSRGPVARLAGLTVQAVGLIGLSQLAPAFQVPVVLGGPGQTSQTASAPSSSSQTSKETKLYVRCPIDFRPRNPNGDPNYGMERVTRHPALWFLGMTAFGSAITAAYPTHLVFFTFPLVFAAIGSEHTDYRYRRGSGGVLTAEREAQTSNIPFLAILQGKQSLGQVLDELKVTNAAAAGLVALALAARRIR